MTKKEYTKAAAIVRQDSVKNGDVFSKLMAESFIKLFRDDNPRFDEKRFRQACKDK